MSWWCKNSWTPDLLKTKSVVVNKTGKVEVHSHPGTAAIEWFLTMWLLLVQSMRHSDCALHIDSCSLQPKHGIPAVRMRSSTCQCFILIWGFKLVRKRWQACPRHHKNSGTRDHQNCTLIGPKCWWGLGQSFLWDFNWSVNGNRWKCASLQW